MKKIRLWWRGSGLEKEDSALVDHYEIQFCSYSSSQGISRECVLNYYPAKEKLLGNDDEVLNTNDYLTKLFVGNSPDVADVYYSLPPFAITNTWKSSQDYFFVVTAYFKDGSDDWNRTDKVPYSDLIAGIKTLDGYVKIDQKYAAPGVILTTTYDMNARHKAKQYQWQRVGNSSDPWEDIPGANQQSYTIQDEDAGCRLRMCIFANDYDGYLDCLEEVNLSCSDVITADFGYLDHLKKIDLSGCSCLKNLNIWHCPGLEELDLYKAFPAPVKSRPSSAMLRITENRISMPCTGP